MLIKVIVSVFAITIGIIFGISFIYFDKLSKYIKKKCNAKGHYKIVQLIFWGSLLIVGFSIVYILPGMLISMLIEEESKAREVLFDIYYYIFPPTFFITLFVLIKKRKLKSDNEKE